MSEPKGFRFDGTEDEWNIYVSELKKMGRTVQEDMSTHVRVLATLGSKEKDNNTATASSHQDRLIEKLLQTDLSKVLINGKYHVDINDLGLIQSAKHELKHRITVAVYKAVSRYWVNLWATKRVNGYSPEVLQERIDNIAEGAEKTKETIIKQEIVKMNMSKDRFFDEIERRVKVTFTVNIPTITLSDLREKDLGKVVQFDCIIVGPTPKKLDEETGKYIQKVLIQEPESTSKDNNPVMILAILHGEDTNYIASGMNKRFIGIYTVAPTKEGTKATNEKTLIIDTISVQDLEEKAEVTLEQYEIDTTKEMAEKVPQQYMKGLIDSFCPKILGRELEKKALYLSLLGGSDIEGYRKESHIMLVGEADTGKSEMVKFANQVAHKSSIIDGSNATGVGVLFALDEYEGMKILRQGAMILNNGGHLIVDEYDKMDKKEQKKLNQAMEQQWASYNKGGHKGHAICKTAIIASCNPEGERWNDDKNLIDNLPFDASTVSRFDLMIRLQHQNHENQVRAKMLHIARRKRGESDHVASPEWLAGLINYQRKLRPVFTPESEELLINRFVEFTQIEQNKGSIQIQTRQMEGIQRLCEAWAKMMFTTKITTQIVEDVIIFYQECMSTIGMNVEKGITQMDLRGHSTNKETYFKDIFRELEDEEGHVSITKLAESLQGNTNMFNSDTSITIYVNRLKDNGWLFEPLLGQLKRQ